jgi:integrase
VLYRRGNIWWFRIKFAGVVIRESAKTATKEIARRAERQRRRELEEGYNRLPKRHAPQTFQAAAERWLDDRSLSLSPKTVRIEKTNLSHLKPVLGANLLSAITPERIADYQRSRLREGASPRTINLEIGTVRAVLRRHRLWANVQPDIRMLPTRDDHGKALTTSEQRDLLHACSESRSAALLPAVVLALNTGLRYREVLNLRWADVDLASRRVIVRQSKTAAGTGRHVPLNDPAFAVVEFLNGRFEGQIPEHYLFASERYGVAGDRAARHSYAANPNLPLKSLKKAWETAKRRSKVVCRFHDLRHTAATRMLEGGTPLMVVASVLGWSPSTAARMAKRYGHIGNTAQASAVALLAVAHNPLLPTARGHRKGHTENGPSLSEHRKLLKMSGSSGWTRTSNPPVNSRMLCH